MLVDLDFVCLVGWLNDWPPLFLKQMTFPWFVGCVKGFSEKRAPLLVEKMSSNCCGPCGVSGHRLNPVARTR